MPSVTVYCTPSIVINSPALAKVNTTGGAAGASQVTTVTKAVFTIAVKGLSEVREELNFVTVYCTPSIVINSPALAPAIAIEAAETPASAGIPIEYTLPAIVILSPNLQRLSHLLEHIR